MPSGSDPPLGLIAGSGALPVLVARGMRAAGRRICAVGLRDQFAPELPSLCDEFRTAGIIQLGRWIRLLRRSGVEEAVMVGRVAKLRMHDPLKLVRQLPDWRALTIWYRRLRHDRRNAALLAAVADELGANGITIIDSTTYIPDHLAEVGVMNGRPLDPAARADLVFGWPLLCELIRLDIGQAVAVRDRDVIAVEAVEGTDRMIERAGTLCRAKGWSLLKTTGADHDRRADVPTVGVTTIENLAKAGGTTLALGAGRVILLDRPAVLAAADRAHVTVVGIDADGADGVIPGSAG